MRIRTKTDLKTDRFAVFENSCFVTTERWSSCNFAFALPTRYQSLCSAFRHSWIPPRGTYNSRSAAGYSRLLAACPALGSRETLCFSLFNAKFHSSSVVCSWKPIICILKTLIRECKKHQIVRKKSVDSAASNNDILVDSDVNIYPIHINHKE